MATTDQELLEAWRGGDQAAGEVLFERYYPAMVRFFANKISGDPADLIQETFMGCVTGAERIREVANFRAFLFGIAYNRLKKHYARGRIDAERIDWDSQSAADLGPGPGTMMAKGAEQRLLLDALRRIPVEHQVVLELFYWESMTSAAIAEVLDEPHGTVRTRIRRARQLLGEQLERLAGDPELARKTSADLDGWAAKIRAGLGAAGADA